VTAAELQNIAMRLSGTLYVRHTLHRKMMTLECLGFTWDAGAGLHWIARTREKERA
jgi:hypothetical protein